MTRRRRGSGDLLQDASRAVSYHARGIKPWVRVQEQVSFVHGSSLVGSSWAHPVFCVHGTLLHHYFFLLSWFFCGAQCWWSCFLALTIQLNRQASLIHWYLQPVRYSSFKVSLWYQKSLSWNSRLLKCLCYCRPLFSWLEFSLKVMVESTLNAISS